MFVEDPVVICGGGGGWEFGGAVGEVWSYVVVVYYSICEEDRHTSGIRSRGKCKCCWWMHGSALLLHQVLAWASIFGSCIVALHTFINCCTQVDSFSRMAIRAWSLTNGFLSFDIVMVYYCTHSLEVWCTLIWSNSEDGQLFIKQCLQWFSYCVRLQSGLVHHNHIGLVCNDSLSQKLKWYTGNTLLFPKQRKMGRE